MLIRVRMLVSGDMIKEKRIYKVYLENEESEFEELASALLYIKSKIKNFDFRPNIIVLKVKDVKSKFADLEKFKQIDEEIEFAVVSYAVAHNKKLMLNSDHVRIKLGEVFSFEGELL